MKVKLFDLGAFTTTVILAALLYVSDIPYIHFNIFSVFLVNVFVELIFLKFRDKSKNDDIEDEHYNKTLLR